MFCKILFLFWSVFIVELRGQVCREMRIISCIPNKFFEGHVISQSIVDSGHLCRIQCFIDKQCISYNLGPLIGTNRACVLSKSDHVMDPNGLKTNSSAGFEYCAFKNPCVSNPCSSGRCQPDETFKSFICNCSTALGMESGAINDNAISASSYVGPGHEPFRGRLNYQGLPSVAQSAINSGVWASGLKNQKAGEYLQVDLGQTMWVSQVATQGRENYPQWVESYSLSYSINGTSFEDYKESPNVIKVFDGNSDQTTVVKNDLLTNIKARYVRIVVQSWHTYICMRAEIYGCPL